MQPTHQGGRIYQFKIEVWGLNNWTACALQGQSGSIAGTKFPYGAELIPGSLC